MNVSKTLDIFPQNLKGLCIIFVVLIHVPLGIEDEWSGWMWIGIRKAINFAVATFFFLSAYYSPDYVSLQRAGIGAYYRKRLFRLLVPYLVWSIIYIFIWPYIFTGHVDNNWLYFLLTGRAQLYFLLVLAQFTLILPLLQRYKINKTANVLFWSVTPLYLLFYYIYNFSSGEEFKPELVMVFPWFACYYLGLKCRQENVLRKLKQQSIGKMSLLCVVVLFLSIAEALFILRATKLYNFAISQITIGSVAYSICMILLSVAVWSKGLYSKPCRLTPLGDYAMGIFLIHPLCKSAIRTVMFQSSGITALYLDKNGYILIQLLILVLTLWLSYLASKKLSGISPVMTTVFGFK